MRNSNIQPPLGMPVNMSHPLAKDLLGTWLLNEGGGSLAFDGITRSNNFSYTVAPTQSLSNKGKSLSFNGSNQYIQNNNNPSIFNQPFTGISLCIWLNLTVVAGLSAFFSKWVIVPSGDHFGLFANSGKIIFVVCNGTNGESGVSGNTTLTANKWYFIVGTWNLSRTINVYVDGVLDGTGLQSFTGINTSSAQFLKMGAQGAGSRLLNGKLHSGYFYGRTLSASDVKQLYINPYQMFI